MRVNYRKSQDILEIIVRDVSGRKLGHYKSNVSDIKRVAVILQTLEAKHGVTIRIPKEMEKEIFDF